MNEFVADMLRSRVLQLALVTGLLASVCCGIVGTYVVTRRITYLAGGIAHCVLGGMGAARYLHVVHGWTALQPVHGAVAAALLAAMIIGLVSLRGREREDTIISALWAIGMATGLLFIAKTPGYREDLMGYLFGNILLVAPRDLWLVGALDVLVVTVGTLFYHQLQAVCFDEEFSRMRGLNVAFYYLLLLGLTALTVVLLVTVVGIVMVVALLTLPAAAASRFSRTLWQTMAVASLLCAAFIVGGLAVSHVPELPAGATIVVLAGGTYFASIAATALMRRRRA